MDIQGKEFQLTATEKKFYLFGSIGFVGMFLLTIIFGSIFTPLTLLQIRLGVVGIGLVYNFVLYYFYQHFLPKKCGNNKSIRPNDITILFNGKELGRK